MAAFIRKPTSVFLLFHAPIPLHPSHHRLQSRLLCAPSHPPPPRPYPSPASCHAKSPSPRSTRPPETPSVRAPKPPSPLRSPYDLVNFRRSRFVAHLNQLARLSLAPHPRDPPTRLDRALTSAGIAHESRVIAHLHALLSRSLSLAPHDILYTVPYSPHRYRLTQAAIERRVPLIRAAALRDSAFAGVADLLMLAKVDPFASPAQRDRAGDSDYVVCEVKLASTCTADYALQAAAYVNMLRQGAGGSADWAYVWTGSPEKPPTQIAVPALMYLFQRTTRDFFDFLEQFDENKVIIPDRPVEMLSPWKGYAQSILEGKDDLHLIAGIRRKQVREIENLFGVSTMTQFADVPVREVRKMVNKHSLNSRYHTLHTQAKMQLTTKKNGGKPTAFEFVQGASSLLLPQLSDADMYFDMEGFPLMENGGLEYLFGVDMERGENFSYWWAHNREQEESAFVNLIRSIHDLVKREESAGHPTPHVYHYGHYEVTALRRVALRAQTAPGHAARIELDKLLDNDVFVDIFKVISSAIIIGEPSYSIKNIEKLVDVSRDDDELADAESSVGMYYEWRRKHYYDDDAAQELTGDNVSHPILHEILHYNQQDCQSLRHVVKWLRFTLPHADNKPPPGAQENPPSETESSSNDCELAVIEPGACGPSIGHKLVDSVAIRRCLDLSFSLVAATDSRLSQETRAVLTHILLYHVRESLPSRMQFSNMVKQASEIDYRDLFENDECISGVILKAQRTNAKTKKEVYEYTFPKAQLFKLTSGNSAAFVVPKSRRKNIADDDEPSDIACFVSVKSVSYDSETGSGSLTLSTSKSTKIRPPSFGVLVSSEDLKVCDAPLRQNILRITENLLRNDLDTSAALPLAFVERKSADEEPSVDMPFEQLKDGKILKQRLAPFLASRRQSCVFVIQGPPGSGKTSLAGEIIQELVMTHGKTVAVSSNSHAAIDNLLSSAVKSGCDKETVWKVGTKCTKPNVAHFKPNLRDVNVRSRYAGSEEAHEPEMSFSNENPTLKRKKVKAVGALIGATCYQLSQESMNENFDFLFVDEASQVPIPNFLSMSTSAKYAVLAGDQQQLEMPIKGAHPRVLEQSCLSYIVGEGVKTVSASRGIFLEKSYRMNPDICEFVSQHFYNHALAPALNCVENKVHLNSTSCPRWFPSSGYGISFISSYAFLDIAKLPSTPSYGRWHQPVEVFTLSKIVDQLIGLPCTVNGRSQTINTPDILVVAPYNAQVRALRDALPQGIRVGTVDKFQGQEAPVAVISTCTSEAPENWDVYEYDGEDAGISEFENHSVESLSSDGVNRIRRRRGLCFALHKNRINVAISRAQCLAIVVGDANAFSRIPMVTIEDIDVASLYESIASQEPNSTRR